MTAHWDTAYAEGDDVVSWSQASAEPSLSYIRALPGGASASVVDVGGGSSRLAGALLDDGHQDVTVLDISQAALDIACARLGDRASRITWIAGDLLAWAPGRTFAVWHDRAMLHFLTDPADQARYVQTLRRALEPDGHVVIATFAPDGPGRCSGLPVERYGAGELMALLGADFTEVHRDHRRHRTPGGREQAFTWLVARCSAR